MIVQPGEVFRFEQEVEFDGYKFGTSLLNYPAGEIEIRRGSDGFYFDGSIFVSTPTVLSTTPGTSELIHYYDFAIPSVSQGGDTYNIRIRLAGDPSTESVGTLLVRLQGSGSGSGSGGGGNSAIAVFDAVDFTTGFPSTIS